MAISGEKFQTETLPTRLIGFACRKFPVMRRLAGQQEPAFHGTHSACHVPEWKRGKVAREAELASIQLEAQQAEPGSDAASPTESTKRNHSARKRSMIPMSYRD